MRRCLTDLQSRLSYRTNCKHSEARNHQRSQILTLWQARSCSSQKLTRPRTPTDWLVGGISLTRWGRACTTPMHFTRTNGSKENRMKSITWISKGSSSPKLMTNLIGLFSRHGEVSWVKYLIGWMKIKMGAYHQPRLASMCSAQNCTTPLGLC